MDNDRKRRWTAHCRRMAEATYALADWCDEPEMMNAYAGLAARWLEMGEAEPPARTSAATRKRAA